MEYIIKILVVICIYLIFTYILKLFKVKTSKATVIFILLYLVYKLVEFYFIRYDYK